MFGSSVITCQSNQRWSSEPPSCSPVHCSEPEELLNGKILGTRYRYKSVISLRYFLKSARCFAPHRGRESHNFFFNPKFQLNDSASGMVACNLFKNSISVTCF